MKTYRLQTMIWTDMEFGSTAEALEWAENHTAFEILETGEAGTIEVYTESGERCISGKDAA